MQRGKEAHPQDHHEPTLTAFLPAAMRGEGGRLAGKKERNAPTKFDRLDSPCVCVCVCVCACVYVLVFSTRTV